MKTAEEIVKEFNVNYPIGSLIKWTSIANEDNWAKEYRVFSEAWVTSYGVPVVFLEGKSGFVSIEPQFIIES